MVQMIGAILLGWASGCPIHSIDEGNTIGRAVTVGGLLVIWVGITFLLLRGSAEPVRTRTGSSDCATTRTWLRTRAREGLPATPDNAD